MRTMHQNRRWLFNRALDRWGVVMALGLLIGYVIGFVVLYPHPGFPRSMDFVTFYAGGRMVLDGKSADLYNLDEQVRYQRALTYPFESPGGALVFNRPPFFIYPFVPLALLSFEAAYLVWMVISLLLGGVALWLVVKRVLPDQKPGWKSWALWCLVTLAFFPAFQSILLGQSSMLELLILVGFYLLYRQGREGLAGALLGLAAFKPQFILFFVLILLVRRSWKGLVGFALVTLAFVLSSLPLVGLRGLLEYQALTGQVYRWNCIYAVYPEMHQSWRGLLVGWLVPRCAGAAPQISTLPALLQANFVATIVSGITILITLALLWRERKSRPGTPGFDLSFAVLILASLLASPYSNPQELTRLVLVAALLVRAQSLAPGSITPRINLRNLVALALLLAPLTMVPGMRSIHPFVWLMIGLFIILAVSLSRRAVTTYEIPAQAVPGA